MTPNALLLALHDAAITIHTQPDGIGWHGPIGAMTLPLAAAIKAHKSLLLGVFETVDDRARDEDWDALREWLIAFDTPTFTPPMLAAAKRVLPVSADEWPVAYARHLRDALRVRGLFRAFASLSQVA